MTPDGSPVIAFKGVYKAFGDKQVLAGVDLDIYPGETMVILGFVVAVMILLGQGG